MIKNKTLRGLALGAVAALAASGLATTPAYAVGIGGDFVSLTPATGTEYTVIAGAGATFTLTSNEASTLVTGDVKFLVTDPSGLVEPMDGTSGRTVAVPLGASVSSLIDGTTSISASGITTAVGVGSLFKFSNDVAVTDVVATASGAVFQAGSTSTANLLVFTGGHAAAVSAGATTQSNTITVLREARNVAGSYVVDTGNSETTTSSTLKLKSPDGETRTVTVTAWKDANDNNVIDATEYVSATRTVTFIKASELEVGTTMTVVPGDISLSAVITTTPVLNGAQVLDFDAWAINAAFTRQGSTQTVYSGADATNSKAAAWNDTTKQFSVDVNLEVGASIGSSQSTTSAAIGWVGLSSPADVETDVNLAVNASGSRLVTITADAGQAPHNLAVGDKLEFSTSGELTLIETTSPIVVTSIPASNSFTINAPTVSTTATVAGDDLHVKYNVVTYAAGAQDTLVDRVFPGTYTARAFIKGAAAGTLVTADAVAATSAELSFATVGSAGVQGTTSGAAAAVKTGTLTVPVTISVLDADEAAVSAGRPVVVTFTTSGVIGAKVNDVTVAQTLRTDANGQVTLNVTSPSGVKNSAMTINASAENGLASGTFVLSWADASYGMFDLASNAGALSGSITRTITAGESYTLDLAVMDQWFTLGDSAAYRLVVTGSGVVEGVRTLTAGKAPVVVTDNGFQTSMATTITLQKLTSGVWGAASSVVVTTAVNKNTNAVLLGADGSSLYGATVDLSSPVAAKALVAADYRLTTAAAPAYANNALVAGKVQNAATSVGVAGAVVTISGPSSILFRNGSVDKLGSISVVTDASGNFNVSLFSTTAQKDTVITVTSLGKSATTKVTFTGTTTGGVGTTLVVTAPDTVAPASTLQVKAKLTDSFGNAVASAPVRVTYTGPGIAFGALPTAVDALGELSFSVLLGGGDTGTITVVVSYDQNGDGDYVDAKDLNTTKTITVGAAAAAPSADQKVNAGSFKGFVAVYAKGYKGQRLSAKIGNDWVIVNSLASDFVRVTDFTGAGVAITVKIYIDRVEVASIPLTTK